MSQFMDLMMGQQSLLMSLATARAADEPVGPVANQPMVLPQPLPIPVAQQDAWDVDAISRDASEGEPLHGEDSVEAELTSHHSESEMEVGVDDSLWSLVERATRHLGIQWPAAEQPRRSLFESPLAQGLQSRTLPAFPDFIKEVQSTWGTPASAPATSRKTAAFTMQGGTLPGGSEPTVDSVSVQPIPTYWYYVMAGGGALLVMVPLVLVMVLYCHRYRYAAKKSQHSIAYKNTPYPSSAVTGVEPTLTIKLEKEDHSPQC
ncbi:UNVERIFIED_CONTAM: hypothetical protein FKN15_055863 [Acipenser sinensis]